MDMGDDMDTEIQRDCQVGIAITAADFNDPAKMATVLAEMADAIRATQRRYVAVGADSGNAADDVTLRLHIKQAKQRPIHLPNGEIISGDPGVEPWTI